MRRLLFVAVLVCAAIVVWRFAFPGERTGDRAAREVVEPAPERRVRPAERAAPETAPEPAEEEYTYRFLVLSAVGEQPLSGVRVHLEPGGPAGETSESGTVTLAWTPTAERYVARKEGFVPGSGFPGGDGALRVLLQPGLVVAGRVVHAIEKTPVAGAEVRAWDLDEEAQLGGTETTDAQGRFRLAGVRANQPFRIVANAAGYAPVFVKRAIDEPLENLVLRIGGGGTLEGSVVHADGTPAVGLELFVVQPRHPPPPLRHGGMYFVGDEAKMVRLSTPHARTDERGAFKIRGLRLDTERVVVVTVSPFFYGRSEPFRFTREDEVVRRDIGLPEPASLRVFAKDAAGELVARAQVDLEDDAFRFVRGSQEPEPDGSRFFREVTPGTYGLCVWFDQGTRLEQQLELKPGEHAVHVVRAVAGALLEGSVVDGAGQPVSAAVWWRGRGKSAHTRTDAAGRFRLTGLVAEPGELRIHPDERLAAQTRIDVVPGGRALRIVLRPGAALTARLHGIGIGTPVQIGFRSQSVGSTSRIELEADRTLRLAVSYLNEPFTFQVEAESFAPIVVDGPGLHSGQILDLGDLRFDQGRTVQARIVDGGGQPVVGARVEVMELWSLDVGARTDHKGVFRIARMPRRKLRLKITAMGSPPHLLELVDPETATQPTLTIGRGGLVVGRAFLGGEPAGGVDVWFYPTDKPGFDPDRAAAGVQCRPDATFAFALQPGEYRAQLWDPKAKERRQVTFEVRKGETTEIEVR
jgi:hypothetical protein